MGGPAFGLHDGAIWFQVTADPGASVGVGDLTEELDARTLDIQPTATCKRVLRSFENW